LRRQQQQCRQCCVCTTTVNSIPPWKKIDSSFQFRNFIASLASDGNLRLVFELNLF
jgi:hypothetical protein